MPTLWINVCEPSADIYAGLLISWLKKHCPCLKIIGMGGLHSRKAGLEALYRAEDLSVMGLVEVFSSLPRILKLLKNIKLSLAKYKPDAIILFDAPDFNFRLAKYAAGLNIPVFYYIAPQLWAWRPSRVKFLKKYVRKVFAIFPFEKEFFQKQGVNTLYVGHPLLELIDFSVYSSIPRKPNKLLLLPGSRKKEVSKLLPVFGQTVSLLQKNNPNLQVTLIKSHNLELNFIKSFLPLKHDYEIVDTEKRYEQMASAKLALAASGTVTLECALLSLPTIITYKLNPISFFIGKHLVNVSAIGMPNLIAREKILPEFIQDEVYPENLTKAILDMLNPDNYQKIIQKLKIIREILGQERATPTVGQHILNFLKE
ncbi:MAG: lipid-A-disaccharide synthase [Desulfonauticus sp.]|nr:lipid-A-disaccharide synthase [Desulfonauticus sp.]